ncbi:MAG: hypothetical protein ACLQM6_00270, partial [Acidobacteriaceae bacterium]
RDQGFDVLLMLEATIGLNEVEPAGKAAEAADSATETATGHFTRNDLNFLKSLRITLPGPDSVAPSSGLNVGSPAATAEDPSGDA